MERPSLASSCFFMASCIMSISPRDVRSFCTFFFYRKSGIISNCPLRDIITGGRASALIFGRSMSALGYCFLRVPCFFIARSSSSFLSSASDMPAGALISMSSLGGCAVTTGSGALTTSFTGAAA